MIANMNTSTGYPFGVIALRSLDDDIVNDLTLGPDVVNLTYMAAYNEAKRKAVQDWSAELEEAEIAASEVDYHMPTCDRDDFVADHMHNALGYYAEEEYVDAELDAFSDMYQEDCDTLEGVYDGVSYRISYLGGAGILWSLDGPLTCVRAFCSPCVPGAADLDSGFDPDGVLCHGVPASWLAVHVLEAS